MSFEVEVGSKPNTNIHALIGRNGVGKTTVLNDMINVISHPSEAKGVFIDESGFGGGPIDTDYFSNLVSISFSAFDPFLPPPEQPDPAQGACYYYIGLKDPNDPEGNKGLSELRESSVEALLSCFQNDSKKDRWFDYIEKLGSDENFSSMNLILLYEVFHNLRQEGNHEDHSAFRTEYKNKIVKTLERMSSGHAIVLLTVTRLVATVTEKTLVILDEPESHLHPPLLSAFIRVLSDLMLQQNGVAIIATHSPVVLQEVPRKCVWKIHRYGKEISFDRPRKETFGENVGTLTNEVFGLEVERSGFHALLQREVNQNKSYETIISEFNQQLGFEGRAILQAMVMNRDNNLSEDENQGGDDV